MDFIDVILGLIYITFVILLASVIWSIYRKKRSGAYRVQVQNGIRVRLLGISVWAALVIFALLSMIIGDGSIVDTIVITLLMSLAVSVIIAGWSFIRR